MAAFTANGLYSLGRGHFLDADIDWSVNNIKLVLVDEGADTPDQALDEDLADRATAARIATSGNFATKTSTNGTADATDITLVSVTGATVESLDIYYDSGVEGTSLMICNINTATGLPLTPNGGNVTVTWNASGIFTL